MAKTKTKLISLDILAGAAECLRTIAHPHRLRMIQMLIEDEYTVGQLAEACEIPPHMASGHLGLMKDRGLLISERRGREIFYFISEGGLPSIMNCIEKKFAR